MPEISSFFGIKCSMYFLDHNPPHFHVDYAGDEALIDIQNASVLRGTLPTKQLKLVLGWCVLRRAELMDDWELVKVGKSPLKIKPLN